MPDLDQLLEDKLETLFRGDSLESVTADLSEETRELVPLLSLAAQTRSLAHPQMDPAVSIRLRRQVMAAAPAPVPSQPFGRAVAAQPRRTQPGSRQNRFPLAAIAAAAVFLLIVISLGVGLAVTGPLNSHYASITDISGSVQLVSASGSAAGSFAANGTQVRQGQQLRTGANSSATLVFFDGSRMTLGPASDITLTTLKGGWGNVLMVMVDQLSGSTNHNVVPFASPKAFYTVNTPSGQASVHGTVFDVDVAANGRAYFSVERGRIQVANASASVFVPAGQASAARPNQQPEAPAYSFALNGDLLSIVNDTWTVANLTFKVTPQTILPVSYKAGDSLSVRGRIASDGARVADWVRLSKNPQYQSTFNGSVESISSSLWEISGQPLLVTAGTQLGAGIKVGDPVTVTFQVLTDGRWQAKEIQRLITQAENSATRPPDPTSSETPTPQEYYLPGAIKIYIH